MLLSAEGLPHAPEVRSDLGHWVFLLELSSAIIIYNDLCRTSGSRDPGVDTNKTMHGVSHGLTPQVWTRIIHNPRLIPTIGDGKQCFQSEFKVVMTKGGARWRDVAFCDKNWFLPEITMVRTDLDGTISFVCRIGRQRKYAFSDDKNIGIFR